MPKISVLLIGVSHLKDVAYFGPFSPNRQAFLIFQLNMLHVFVIELLFILSVRIGNRTINPLYFASISTGSKKCVKIIVGKNNV